jgi:hypothetical protein
MISASSGESKFLLYRSRTQGSNGRVRESIFSIAYRFRFPNGEVKEFHVALERPAMSFVRRPRSEDLPAWTDLSHQQCVNCPLSTATHTHCPVAVNLVDVVEAFADVFSYDEADVEVVTDARKYCARVRNTHAVGSLIGIYMVTSGCPIMDKMRPMILTHLPFATTEESIYRSISMYLMAQYFRYKKGGVPDWDLKGFTAFFDEVTLVNRSFVKRLTTFVERDASLNAVVLLNCFATATRRMVTRENFQEIEQMFGAYFENPPAGA